MHLLIPFASALSDAAVQVVHDLRLPTLARLLSRLAPTLRDTADAFALSPPHERALAAAWGWPVVDGLLPFAARAAADDGIDVGDLAWARLTPTHWHVGRDHVTLADPAALELSADESREAFAAIRPLFESEGIAVVWTAPGRWYAAHASFADLKTASLDRVIGRNVELWMRPGANPEARLVRRLQSEVQMLMYPHPLNEAREADGRLTLNSFWLSDCGPARPTRGEVVEIDARLRAPLLGDDWAAWADAWRALDADALPALLEAAAAGRPAALTLCGERSAQRYETAPQSLWARLGRRWQATPPARILEAL